MKYITEILEGSKKKTEVERSQEKSKRREQGAYQKATRALKGETKKEFGFTNPKALMSTAKVGEHYENLV